MTYLVWLVPLLLIGSGLVGFWALKRRRLGREVIPPALEPGTSVLVELLTAPPSGDIEACIERVERKALWLSCQQTEGAPPGFVPNEAVRVKYWDAAGLYYFDSRLIALSETEARISLSPPGRIIAVQRREFFRLNQEVEFTFTRSSPGIPQKPVMAHTSDISAGGLRFKTSVPLQLGDLLVLRLLLEGGQEIECKGKVVRLGYLEEQENRTFEIGVEFVALSVEGQDHLVRHLFAAQLHERRRSRRKRVDFLHFKR